MTSSPLRVLGLTALIVLALTGCTTVTNPSAEANGDASGDGTGNGLDGVDVIGSGNDDPCNPDPCALQKRTCVDGVCGDCLKGVDTGDGVLVDYIEDGDFCVPDNGLSGDPECKNTACAAVNKECIGVSCGDCLPGYIESDAGNCLPQSACYPNPCVEPLRTVCQVNREGQPVCNCDAGAHDDGAGNCTFDPCIPNECQPPTTVCQPDGLEASCVCPDSEVLLNGDCYPDPCIAHASQCTEIGQVCVFDEVGKPECVCGDKFIDESGTCIEAPATNGTVTGEPVGDIEIDDNRQVFVDDWMIRVRTNMVRQMHPPELINNSWAVTPDPEDGIGRARAGGSVVFVDAANLDALPAPSPLKGYPWRMYYMGLRQQFTATQPTQPAWVCVAAAMHPAGPWFKPAIRPGTQGENCVLMVDGLVNVEVTRRDSDWTMSATKRAMGTNTQAGVFVYRSVDGLSWLPESSDPIMPVTAQVISPAKYPRVGARSRLVWDSWEERFTGLVDLPSEVYGDARGIVFGDFDPQAGWPATLNAANTPAIMGPSPEDLFDGKRYTDMVAWREGSLWLGLVLRQKSACPWVGEVIAASSRDGENWVPLVDEVTGSDVFIAPSALEGLPNASIESLSGGRPAEADGAWYYLVGGTDQAVCSGEPAAGGALLYGSRPAGLAGLTVSPQAPGVVITRPLRLRDGMVGAAMAVDATVGDKLMVQVEALSAGDTVLGVAEAIIGVGDHRGALVASEPLHSLTADRFRVRFTFLGPGELFGFRIYDPVCSPNPCTEQGRTVCDSVTGSAVCLCNPPAHDDGLGGCTIDPCTPDPCTGPNQLGCTAVGGLPVCGCVDGWVPKNGSCIPDPCLPQNTPTGVPCPPPEDRCKVVNGDAVCYCPEGSTGGPAGCSETDLRIFVSSLAARGDTLGGTGGADSLCSTLANAAGLPGAYAAWLSTSDLDAIDRFANGGPWRTWDPDQQLWSKLVAYDIWDMTDGDIGTAINRTEYGAPVSGNCLVWTGTASDGEVANTEGIGGTCSGWTSSEEGFGLTGLCDADNELWTEWAPALCTKESRFYCLQLP
ncbi:MAG: hypothetical protein ACPGU1_08050 [Myxococcota bacterium]